MKKVIVAGGAGFIGRNCLRPLLDKGYEVHVLDRTALKEEFPEVFWHEVDLTNQEKVDEVVKEIKASHLLSFAWITKHREYWNSLENSKCVQMSSNLLEVFTASGGKRVVMAGSCAEYDWSMGVCSEENTPLKPSTYYGACKSAMYQMLMGFGKAQGISCAWGRIFFVFGPYENPQRFVASVIRSLLKAEEAKCSDGTQIRDFMSTEDLGSAFAALLDSEVNGAVNVASGEPFALKDIVAFIAEQLEKEELVRLGAFPNNPNEPQIILAQTERLNKEVGWKMPSDTKTRLKETINWWKGHLKNG